MAAKHIALITGANSGIGFEAIKALARSSKPYYIFLASPSLQTSQETVDHVLKEIPDTASTIEPVEIELTSDESIANAVQVIGSKVDRIDSLVNNAGVAPDTGDFIADIPNTRSIFNQAYNVNVTGTQVLTTALVPLLLKSTSPRLVFLTSGVSTLIGHSKSLMGANTATPKPGWPKEDFSLGLGYKLSKTALNMLMLNWHWILKEDGVKTFAISPGYLATHLGGSPDIMRSKGAGDASLGGDIIRRVVEGERDADAGNIVTQNGKVQDW